MSQLAPCPVPHRNFRVAPMTADEVDAVKAWYDVVCRPAVEARSCNVPRCGKPGRLYMAGYRCGRHKP